MACWAIGLTGRLAGHPMGQPPPGVTNWKQIGISPAPLTLPWPLKSCFAGNLGPAATPVNPDPVAIAEGVRGFWSAAPLVDHPVWEEAGCRKRGGRPYCRMMKGVIMVPCKDPGATEFLNLDSQDCIEISIILQVYISLADMNFT